MCGCSRRARMRRSREKRERTSSDAMPRRSSLIATCWSNEPSARSARRTSPMPPRPSRPSDPVRSDALGRRRLVRATPGSPSKSPPRDGARPASRGSGRLRSPPRGASRRAPRDRGPRAPPGGPCARTGESSTSSSKSGRTSVQRPGPLTTRVRRKLLVEKRARRLPVALDRAFRPARHLRDLLHREPGEKAPLDELRELAVDFAEPAQRLVERDDLRGALLDRYLDVLEIQGPPARAAPLPRPRARLVDEDHPHRPPGEREEVGAVLRRPAGAARELEIRLVDEGGRRERPLRRRALELPVGDRAQLSVKY